MEQITDHDLENMYQEYLHKQTSEDIRNHIYMECDECGAVIDSTTDHCLNCGKNIECLE